MVKHSPLLFKGLGKRTLNLLMHEFEGFNVFYAQKESDGVTKFSEVSMKIAVDNCVMKRTHLYEKSDWALVK